MEPEEIDCTDTQQITCPYCGWEDNDSWDHFGLKDDGDVDDLECGRCEKTLEAALSISISYSTSPL